MRSARVTGAALLLAAALSLCAPAGADNAPPGATATVTTAPAPDAAPAAATPASPPAPDPGPVRVAPAPRASTPAAPAAPAPAPRTPTAAPPAPAPVQPAATQPAPVQPAPPPAAPPRSAPRRHTSRRTRRARPVARRAAPAVPIHPRRPEPPATARVFVRPRVAPPARSRPGTGGASVSLLVVGALALFLVAALGIVLGRRRAPATARVHPPAPNGHDLRWDAPAVVPVPLSAADAVDDAVDEPEPAAAPSVERCEIVWWRGYVRSQFVACTADDPPRVVAESPLFAWRRSEEPPESGDALAAHQELLDRLAALGWEPEGVGPSWFQGSFREPDVQEPPTPAEHAPEPVHAPA